MSGVADVAIRKIENAYLDTCGWGSVVHNILVDGRHETDPIHRYYDCSDKGDPIFGIHPAIRAEVERLSWVKKHMERRLPDTLYIHRKKECPWLCGKSKKDGVD